MKIISILNQYRRDFTAVFQCEHCGIQTTKDGYDDKFFHEDVIPAMQCDQCGKTAPENYHPLTTKYPEGVQV